MPEIGAYVIRARSGHVRSAEGSSSIVYIGEGDIARRLSCHANGDGNPEVAELVQAGRHLVVDCAATRDKADAIRVEAIMLTRFERVHGEKPLGNVRDEFIPEGSEGRFAGLYPLISQYSRTAERRRPAARGR